MRIYKPGQLFNRIHVADICQCLTAAMEKPAPGIYNISDDLPASPADVTAYAAQLLGIAPPPEIPLAQANLSARSQSFFEESKKLQNHAVKKQWNLQWKYPNYYKGLQDIYEESLKQ